MKEKINFESADGLGWITLDDGKANTMDDLFFDQLNSTLDMAETGGVRVLVVSGRDGFFSAGLNLKYVAALDREAILEFNRKFAQTLLRVLTLPIPTIAVCTGHAIAGGAMLALACDLRFIRQGPYKFQVNETAIGIPVPEWMMSISRYSIPQHLCTEALLHARPYSPEEAVNAGVFQGLLAVDDDPREKLQGRIKELSLLNEKAYRITKAAQRNNGIDAVLKKQDEELKVLFG